MVGVSVGCGSCGEMLPMMHFANSRQIKVYLMDRLRHIGVDLTDDQVFVVFGRNSVTYFVCWTPSSLFHQKINDTPTRIHREEIDVIADEIRDRLED